MTVDPKPGRRSIRLKGYDYSQAGGYFITTCTTNRTHLFGEVVNGEMRLSEYGEAVRDVWHELPMHYPHVILDAFVIMPDHVHGIIVLTNDIAWANSVRAGLKPAPTIHGLPEIVRGFKTFSARRINECRRAAGFGV